MTKPQTTYATSVADSVEALTVLIERSATDITADYGDWCSIGFALAHEFGADGEPFFHRISAFYPNYDPQTAQKQYAACLRHRMPSGKAPITIATLFHIAKSHGINLPAPSSDGLGSLLRPDLIAGCAPQSHPFSSRNPNEEMRNEENSRLADGSSAYHEPLPSFSQSIRSSLPSIMQRIIADSVSDVDADILILGSLTVFSACIPNVYGMYDCREVFANLFLFVTASASAGKGRLSLCRHLAAPLHQALREKYKKQMKKYEAAQVAYAVNRKNTLEVPPKEPPFLTLFVPANSTATVVYQTLAQNNGVGLLFETEGDTLANAFNSDLGNYSDGFRKAFHHETISYLRKKDHEYVEIVKPKFSAVLSGTPQQIFNLIPDAENGLFSRFIFYVMETELVWHNMFASHGGTTADEKFKEIGRDFFTFLKKFPKRPVQFTLSRSQMDQFNAYFEATQLRFAQLLGDEIVATVRRLGLILFRFAMILTVLRRIDDAPKSAKSGDKKLRMVCSDADFDTALAMVKVLLQHSAAVFQALPRNAKAPVLKGRQVIAAETREKFLAALPETFDRPTYIKTAASLNITEKTAERYLQFFIKSGQLLHPSTGQYRKNPEGVTQP
ncbi:MAG: DUF3987 domain-containing protein [Bacteroidales bacterium]|nr:DUF3987 domain-containing protein [Bacteroidales bacterium]MBR4240071.1 DUF3987 domain-containing protein [Prevotella sp.]MBR4700028.1 DUF3987 domain-containing protein [Prevotella sp.]